jgi:hypothetical protein
VRRRRLFTARGLLRPCLIAYGDEQGGHVFAVVTGLLEGGTTALGRDTVSAELDGRRVGVRVRTLDASGCIGLTDLEVPNDLSLFIVKAA